MEVKLIKVVKLKKIVDALIEFVRTDYETKFALDKEEDTFLYKALYGNVDGDYDFYTQAKAIFLRTAESPRKIRTSLMFNKDIKGHPCIHVREPAKGKGSFNSIGGGLGGNFIENSDGGLDDLYRDTKRGNYELMITSDNALDTTLICEVLQALLIGAYETLNEMFSTFDFSTKELMMENNLVPIQLYVKAITIDVQQENFIPSILTNDEASQINFALSSLDSTSIPIAPAVTQYTLEIDIIGDGSVETNPVPPTIGRGRIVSVKVTPDSGNVFVNININGVVTTDSLMSFEMNRDTLMIVTFEPI
jgi:hypothetical protein